MSVVFFLSSSRRHTSSDRDWSSDVCSSDLAERLDGKAELQVGECSHRRLGSVDEIVNERLRLAKLDIVINADQVGRVITIDEIDQPLSAGTIKRAIGAAGADDVFLAS